MDAAPLQSHASNLRTYYERLFPWAPFSQWLHYGADGTDGNVSNATEDTGREECVAGRSYFSRREFSFMLEHGVVIRKRHFVNEKYLYEEVMRLRPQKIDIGAVDGWSSSGNYRSHMPAGVEGKDKDKDKDRNKEKELVFDIDLTDYDGVRVCCAGDAVCRKCWLFVTVAIKILDGSLRHEFGFVHIFWVFSGRRGVHCWVCDAGARNLPAEVRAEIVAYFRIPPVNTRVEESRQPHIARGCFPIHPMLWRAYLVGGQPYIDRILADQQPPASATEARLRWEVVAKAVQCIAQGEPATETRDNEEGAASPSAATAPPPAPVEVATAYDSIVRYIRPILDAEVTKQVSHLLKIPWAVHPKTGKICVPIDVSRCDEFDPERVPTVEQVVRELAAWRKTAAGVDADEEVTLCDYDKTSLGPYVQFWKNAFLMPMLPRVT